MANPRGVFTEELVPEGWFDETAQAAGWFDQDNVDVAAASGSPYSLPVTTAAVTLTGSTVALRRALRLSVSTAAITLTGSTVALRAARKLAVTTAAVTLTGSTVATKAGRRLAVGTSAVTLAGSSVTLTYTPSTGAPFSLAVGSAAITLTGSEIGLTYTPAIATQAPTGGGGGFAFQNDRALRWKRDEEEREDLRKQLLAVLEPAVTTAQIEKAETSDTAAITLAEKVIAKPDALSAATLQQVARLIQDLMAAQVADNARRIAAQHEEEAIVLLLAA